MKRIIYGKKYDTESAHRVCDPVSPTGMYDVRDFHYFEETLYRKKTGEYFLYGWGGALSPYAEPYGQNGSQGGERIVPFTPEQAREWAESHLDADEYEAEFGPVEDDGETVAVTVRISKPAKAVLDRLAYGSSQSAAIESLLMCTEG